jgi:hypothetical protein
MLVNFEQRNNLTGRAIFSHHLNNPKARKIALQLNIRNQIK